MTPSLRRHSAPVRWIRAPLADQRRLRRRAPDRVNGFASFCSRPDRDGGRAETLDSALPSGSRRSRGAVVALRQVEEDECAAQRVRARRPTANGSVSTAADRWLPHVWNGAQLEQLSRFCPDCGSPVGAAIAPGVAPASAVATTEPSQQVAAFSTELRHVSVLFCDLVGFTPLAEQRDPEEVRELLSGYFELARAIVGRYGGVIQKFIGDAVMAVWGAPIAKEDDAERAVRAGLELDCGRRRLRGRLPDGSPGPRRDRDW